MTAVNPAASQQAAVEAALVLLEQMGLSPADLTAVPMARKPAPTFGEYVPVVSATVSAGTRRAYGSYWNRVVDQWGGQLSVRSGRQRRFHRSLPPIQKPSRSSRPRAARRRPHGQPPTASSRVRNVDRRLGAIGTGVPPRSLAHRTCGSESMPNVTAGPAAPV